MDAKWYANWFRFLPASSADEKMRDLEVADLLEQLEAQVPRWISVEERLPEDMVDVLLYGEGRFGMGLLSNGWWCCEGMDGVPVTHWMKMPEAPEEDVNERID